MFLFKKRGKYHNPRKAAMNETRLKNDPWKGADNIVGSELSADIFVGKWPPTFLSASRLSPTYLSAHLKTFFCRVKNQIVDPLQLLIAAIVQFQPAAAPALDDPNPGSQRRLK